jgi:hypothetical protein
MPAVSTLTDSLGRRTALRAMFAVIVLLSAVQIGLAYQSSLAEGVDRAQRTLDPGTETDGFTVATAATGSNGQIVAWDENGTVRFRNDTYPEYFDADPSPVGKTTLLYTASKTYTGPGCSDCALNVIERVNMTTGEVTRLYSHVIPYRGSVRYHDVDRINDTHFVVADIAGDQVFIVDTETGIREWTYDAQSVYTPESGGEFKGDWTHVNDVEVLSDGRIMVSLRNHDSVVFLNRSTGQVTDWTLGTDDDHSTLYEQHNPDYIPRANGGPNVIVADSENHRVVEYHRTEDGEWTQVWTWTDDRLTWPRDADRLPNGHTLVTGSGSDRVMEIDESGSIVWSASITMPYEAERLGTGSESANGPAASEAGLQSRTGAEDTESANEGDGSSGRLEVPGMLEVWLFVKNALPGPLVNGLLFVLPSWLGTSDLPALVGLAGALGTWTLSELYWFGVRIRSPVTRRV